MSIETTSGIATLTIPSAVIDETSERGGVSPLVLGRKPVREEPGGLRHPAQKPLTLGREEYSPQRQQGSETRGAPSLTLRVT